jgi:ParB-like chromosome segregation protein Spo0J
LPADPIREEPGDIEALGESIAQHGLLAPLLIEPDGTVRAGRRRVEAMRARLSTRPTDAGTGPADPDVECLILPPGVDPAVAQIVENIQRKDLTPLEEAKAYGSLIKATGWTQARVAREVGVPSTRVGSRLNLLDAPSHVQAKVESGEANAWVVADAFGKKGRREGRAEKVSERLRRGDAVRARFAPASVRVPAAALPENVRAKVFRDRVEITVILKDDTPDLSGLGRVADAVRAPLAASAGAVLAALRSARARTLQLEGLD